MKNDTMRFVLPITLENMLTIFVGMVLSALIGGVSNSALAAASVPNTLLNVYNGFYSVLTSGAAVLTSRLLGAGKKAEASRTIEQSILIALTTSVAVGFASILGAQGIMRMLMRTAEDALVSEAAAYFRMLALSFPFFVLYNVLASVIRAAGNTKSPMIASVLMNVVQIGAMFLFLRGMNMGVAGAGLSYLVCRAAGAGLLFWICIREHEQFAVQVKGMLHLDGRIAKRIARIGLPTTFESVSVQIGYLVANMMVIGLGTWPALVFQISSSLLNFAVLPGTTCPTVVTTFVGHRLGQRDREGARRESLKILMWGALFSAILSLGIAVAGVPLSRLYTTDEAAAVMSGKMMWVLIGYNVFAILIDVMDPALRVGGDVKFVMWQTNIGVWVFRLPLSWLLGYKLHLGVAGLFWANIISLAFRATSGLLRFHKGKWLDMRV